MEKKDKIAIELEIKDLLYSANNKINLATTLTENAREGLVFRNDDATKSFKAVDPEFIIKYHG